MDDSERDDGPKDQLEKDAPRAATMVAQAFDRMECRRQGVEKPIVSPWTTLNEALDGGLWPGVHLLAGNTGVGKSQWVIQLSHHNARQGIPTLLVTLDMDELQVLARLACLSSDHHWSTLTRGATDKLADIQKATRADLDALPLHIEAASPFGWGGSDLYTRIEALRKAYCLGPRESALAVVDCIQLAASERGDIAKNLAILASHARQAARSLNAVVVLVSTIAPEHGHLASLRKAKDQGRLAPIPITPVGPNIPPDQFKGLGDQTGQIEHWADTILCLCREPRDPDNQSDDVWMAVAKNRAGVPAWVRLFFDGSAFDDPRHLTN